MTSTNLQLRKLSIGSPTPRPISLLERAHHVARLDAPPIWEPVPGAAPTAPLAPIAIPGEDVMIAAIERPWIHPRGTGLATNDASAISSACSALSPWPKLGSCGDA